MSLFTPMSGLLGGALIGASAGILLHTNGAIMGFSGLIRSYLHPTTRETPQWKFALLGSFLVTVQLCLLANPNAAAPYPSTDVPTRTAMLLGGFLVGIGTKLGNGCTSGHGICGLGRASIRSLTAVLSFLTAGMMTAVTISSIPWLRQELRTTGIPNFSGALGMAVTALTVGLAMTSKPTKEVYGAITSGCLGALGLLVGGMVNTSKVIGFLDLTRLWNGNYDPTLMTVMGGGVVISALFYQILDQSKPPLLAPKWSIPSHNTIDNRLVGGAVLFGIGWAFTGICPGPALWQLGSGSIPMAMFFFPAFLAGTYIGEKV